MHVDKAATQTGRNYNNCCADSCLSTFENILSLNNWCCSKNGHWAGNESHPLICIKVRVHSHCAVSCFHQHHESSYSSGKSTSCWQGPSEGKVTRSSNSEKQLSPLLHTKTRGDRKGWLTRRPRDSLPWTSTATGCTQVWECRGRCTTGWCFCHTRTRRCSRSPSRLS